MFNEDLLPSTYEELCERLTQLRLPGTPYDTPWSKLHGFYHDEIRSTPLSPKAPIQRGYKRLKSGAQVKVIEVAGHGAYIYRAQLAAVSSAEGWESWALGRTPEEAVELLMIGRRWARYAVERALHGHHMNKHTKPTDYRGHDL